MIANIRRKSWLAILPLLCCSLFILVGQRSIAQAPKTGKLTVKVTGIRNADGNIRVALRTDDNTIVDARVVEIDPKTLTAVAVFENMAAGTMESQSSMTRTRTRSLISMRKECPSRDTATLTIRQNAPVLPTSMNQVRLRRTRRIDRDRSYLLALMPELANHECAIAHFGSCYCNGGVLRLSAGPAAGRRECSQHTLLPRRHR